MSLAVAGLWPGIGLAEEPLANEKERTLYALGVFVGTGLQSFSLEAGEREIFLRGVRDELAGTELAIDAPAYQAQIQSLQEERLAAAAAKEAAAAEAFLAGVAAEEGVLRLDSGLLYDEREEGSGASPGATSTVRVHYRGTLRSGKEFDSSYSRGQPAEFPLNRVIACWTEGLQRMKVGGKARLVCPGDIAYGANGHPPSIPGNAVLSFDIELLAVDP